MDSRVPIAVAVAGAVLAGTVAVAGADVAERARKPSSTQPQNASAQLLECSQGHRRRDRWALFRGEMAHVAGAERMRMRFQLTERVARRAWRPVRAPGLGVWRDSRRGAPGFAYNQRVVGLERAAAYRVHVAFRWYDADGDLVARERHGSRPCRQRGRLPNLVLPGDVHVRPGPTAGTARYAVRVANRGRGGARRVRVLLRVDRADVMSRPVGSVRPGRARIARLLGPACVELVEMVVDPDDAIRESSEEDNAASAVCPSSH